MKAHFLQSSVWAEFQETIGRRVLLGSGAGWSYVGLVEHDRFGTYIYVPYGPAAEDRRAFKAAVAHLYDAAKQAGAYVVYIEPADPITKADAAKLLKQKAPRHRQAHRTIRINLSKTEDDLLLDMSKTRRKQYRNYHKKDITIEESNTPETLDIFYELLDISSKEKGFYIRNKQFFEAMFERLVPRKAVSLFVAKQAGKVEVAALVYDDEDTRYYAHVGRDLTDNSLQATAPLIAYMIFDAKRQGKKWFDLYGISERDDVADEKSGFTEFKKSFGGTIIEYGGAWELPIDPVRYRLAKAFRLAKTLPRTLLKKKR